MKELIIHIITDVLTALYQPFGFSVILSVLVMFFLMYAQERGWREICKKWWKQFKTSSLFRREFLLIFYITMILFRTLLNRNMWANPLSNVLGAWGLYNEQGEFTTEAIENLFLFIPFVILLLWTLKDKLIKKRTLISIIFLSGKITFFFSLAIEFAQLFFRIGTFQLSDLFYNTLGGTIGGAIYYFGIKWKENK